jgi:hypothetical protein
MEPLYVAKCPQCGVYWNVRRLDPTVYWNPDSEEKPLIDEHPMPGRTITDEEDKEWEERYSEAADKALMISLAGRECPLSDADLEIQAANIAILQALNAWRQSKKTPCKGGMTEASEVHESTPEFWQKVIPDIDVCLLGRTIG